MAAVIRVPVAPLLAEPRISSGQTSQLLAGHPVSILEDHDDWLLACGDDGYTGWMHHGYLDRDAAPVERAALRLSLGCVSRAGGPPRHMPLGAWLLPGEDVLAGDVLPLPAQAAAFPCTAEAICATARRYFTGTSYLWGGVTPWGADCSGLVQAVFGLHGIPLRRDACQQAEQGEDAGTQMLDLATGNLLFFSDRPDLRVTHVGIASDRRRMIHLAVGRGGWFEECLDATDPYTDKLRERFLFARRVLPGPN